MASGRQFPGRFAPRGRTPMGTVHVVLADQVVLIMEMRIFVNVLVMFGVVLDRRLGLVAHGQISRRSFPQWLVGTWAVDLGRKPHRTHYIRASNGMNYKER